MSLDLIMDDFDLIMDDLFTDFYRTHIFSPVYLPVRISSCEIVFLWGCLSVRLSSTGAVFLANCYFFGQDDQLQHIWLTLRIRLNFS